MFSRAKNNAGSQNLIPLPGGNSVGSNPGGGGGPSMIGVNVLIEGRIATTGELHLDGRVDGDVRSETVVISETGRVFGSVEAETVVVHGVVSGTIVGKRVYLAGNCKVVADITHDLLCIDEGAAFEGQCRRKADVQPAIGFDEPRLALPPGQRAEAASPDEAAPEPSPALKTASPPKAEAAPEPQPRPASPPLRRRPEGSAPPPSMPRRA